MSTKEPLEITSVERIDGTELIVEFSDGTYAVLTTEQVVKCAGERQREYPRTNGDNGQVD